MSIMPLIEGQVRAQYKLLNHDGLYTRVRASNEKEGKEDLISGVEQLIKWARSMCGTHNLYLSRNAFTKDGTPCRVSAFSIDIDPVRQPKTRASTNAELFKALGLSRRILCEYRDVSPVSSISGNGTLVIMPFESINEDLETYTKQAQEFERQLIKQFSTEEVRIDATQYAKAILRLMGSVNVKDADPRKHRYARFIGRARFHPRRSRIFEAIKGIAVPQSVITPELASVTGATNLSRGAVKSYEKGEPVGSYVSRSDADFALALRYQTEGLGPDACMENLLKFGFRCRERPDDAKRITEKVYAAGSTQQRAGTLLSNMRHYETPKLWTPGEPISSNGSGTESGPCISTGFKWLNDKLNGGYRGGVVYAVEAATNIGKSQFIVQTTRNVCETSKRCLLVTTEASISEVCQRYWAIGTGIPASQISNGRITDEQRQVLERYREQFKSHQLGIWYTVSPKTQEIEGLINEFKPDIVLWDYFQHFETGTESRQIQLGSLARWFESAALRYQIPFVVAAQLHERFGFKDRKKLPAIKDDIKDCKTLNDAAKTVIVLDWAEKQDTSGDAPVITTFDVQKNKGPLGKQNFLLRRNIPRFEDI